MSWNRENVIWQSKNGSWNIGFFRSYSSPSQWDDEDFDPEWDVEYDYDEFFFASVGHPSEDSAWRAWKGANPGGSTVMRYSKENAEDIARYDRMALFHLHPEAAAAEVKKENARLKREHVKKLREQFAANNDFANRKVQVKVKLDDRPWDGFGASQSYVGFLKQDGDWLVIDRVKVKNTKTGRLNARLAGIELARTSSHGYYRY